MLESYFVDECQKVETTRDDFGQEITGVTTTLACRWRDITKIRRGANMDTSDADALIHFAPGTDVQRGTILLFDGDYYKVERITKAKRLGESTAQFIKCEAYINTIGIS